MGSQWSDSFCTCDIWSKGKKRISTYCNISYLDYSLALNSHYIEPTQKSNLTTVIPQRMSVLCLVDWIPEIEQSSEYLQHHTLQKLFTEILIKGTNCKETYIELSNINTWVV